MAFKGKLSFITNLNNCYHDIKCFSPCGLLLDTCQKGVLMAEAPRTGEGSKGEKGKGEKGRKTVSGYVCLWDCSLKSTFGNML